MSGPTRTIIMGAGGRDFHNFNTFFRGNPDYDVVAFTATQIPGIAGRTYPALLSGPQYPNGIPIFPEEELPRLIRELRVDQVVFAYSDVSHQYVMDKASQVLSLGPDFRLMGPDTTMLKADVPVVAVCAVRTGAGKSQTSRHVVAILRGLGLKVVVVRHPMPYGDLTKEVCQRFQSKQDLDRYDVTIEEREEYEQHIEAGNVVFAGADYEAILRHAEKEAQIIIWDGGNNDLPFYRPDLHIVVADPHRAGHERTYYPGATNFRMADVIVINKVDTARREDVEQVRRNAHELNPSAIVIEAASPITVDKPELITGKSVLVIEDGPTLTHGEMRYGAGTVAARINGASDIVDPRPYAVGSIVEVYHKYPHIGPVLPAMGYGEHQIDELEQTIERTPAETVVVATPIDLRRIVKVSRPLVRVRYSLKEVTSPTLKEILEQRFQPKGSP